MAKCCFENRECTEECIGYTTVGEIRCTVLAKLDRTTQLLNFIEKKIDKLLEK